MRFVKSLLMLLMLVTFSTGFGNTTADLKQNSKTVFVQYDLVQAVAIEAVSVVDFLTINNHLPDVGKKVLKGFEVINFSLKTHFNPNKYAVIRDVGWKLNQAKFKEIPHNENLLDNKDFYRYNKNKLKINENEIRHYGVLMTFSFTRNHW